MSIGFASNAVGLAVVDGGIPAVSLITLRAVGEDPVVVCPLYAPWHPLSLFSRCSTLQAGLHVHFLLFRTLHIGTAGLCLLLSFRFVIVPMFEDNR